MQCLVLKKKKNPTNLQFWTLKNYFQNWRRNKDIFRQK
jgi:hypothetical protein